MEHIIELISEYAGDVTNLKGIISQRNARVRELELKITRLEKNIESTRELYNEGYLDHEIDILM